MGLWRLCGSEAAAFVPAGAGEAAAVEREDHEGDECGDGHTQGSSGGDNADGEGHSQGCGRGRSTTKPRWMSMPKNCARVLDVEARGGDPGKFRGGWRDVEASSPKGIGGTRGPGLPSPADGTRALRTKTELPGRSLASAQPPIQRTLPL